MKTILVVEDDHDVRVILRKTLEGGGYFVLSVGHGKEALKLLETCTTPSMIISDVNMPVMGGVQFLAALRARPEWASIPILQLSAEQGPPMSGVCCAMKKPLDLDELLAAIKVCFER